MSDTDGSDPRPERAAEQFVHPSDSRRERRLLVLRWWFARVGSLPIALAVAASVWLATGSAAVALLSLIAAAVIGRAASRWLLGRSSRVPRPRRSPEQLASGDLPATALDGLGLIAAATALTLSVRSQQVPVGVISFAIGAAIGIALVQVIELVPEPRGTRDSHRRASRLILLVAALASACIAGTPFVGTSWIEHLPLVLMVLVGAATILLAHAVWRLANRSGTRGAGRGAAIRRHAGRGPRSSGAPS